jgi:hypothetical protein
LSISSSIIIFFLPGASDSVLELGLLVENGSNSFLEIDCGVLEKLSLGFSFDLGVEIVASGLTSAIIVVVEDSIVCSLITIFCFSGAALIASSSALASFVFNDPLSKLRL